MTTETAPAAPQAVSGKEYQLLINGQHVAPKSGEMMERRYPANNDVTVAKFPKANEEDVDAAIEAARKAFDSGGWSNAPARNRSAERGGDRGSADRGCVRVLRGPGAGHQGSGDLELRQRRDRDDPQGACGRRGDHHALELPDAAGDVEARAGARGGLHLRHQAGHVHALHDVRAGAHPDRGRRAGGRGERRDWLGQDGGRADRRFAADRCARRARGCWWRRACTTSS